MGIDWLVGWRWFESVAVVDKPLGHVNASSTSASVEEIPVKASATAGKVVCGARLLNGRNN